MQTDILDDFAIFEERDMQIEIAARSIVALCREDRFGRGWRPKGVDEVAILLESMGYSSEIIASLGYAELFDLASDVNGHIERFVSDEERSQTDDTHWFVSACRDYATGALYSGPWIIAVLGLLIFGTSLWSSLSTPLHLATAIALGVYGAQVISGAFSQAIARRLTFYYFQDNASLMLWTLERFMGAAVVGPIVLGIIGAWALRFWYGDPDAYLAASFFVGSALFQISLTPLYTLRRFAWIITVSLFATLVTGLTFSGLFHREVTLPWEPATLAIEMGVIGLSVMSITLGWMRSRAKREGGGRVVPPGTRAIVEISLPYAFFGACYFLSIIVDHVAAGLSTGFPFQYNANYELGTDVALVGTIPIVGVINVALESLPRRILTGAATKVTEARAFDRKMLRFYGWSVAGVLLMTVPTVWVSSCAFAFILAHTQLGASSTNAVESAFVLKCASIGYGVLMLSLLNTQILFFLNRPRPAFWASFAALMVNAVWGTVVCAAHLPGVLCVFGLDAAILVFSVTTTIMVVIAVRRFTYAYYAAY